MLGQLIGVFVFLIIAATLSFLVVVTEWVYISYTESVKSNKLGDENSNRDLDGLQRLRKVSSVKNLSSVNMSMKTCLRNHYNALYKWNVVEPWNKFKRKYIKLTHSESARLDRGENIVKKRRGSRERRLSR